MIIETAALRNKYGPYPVEIVTDAQGNQSNLLVPYGPGAGRLVGRDPLREVAGDVVHLGDSTAWIPTYRYNSRRGHGCVRGNRVLYQAATPA